MKRMAVSTSREGSLISRRFILCVVTSIYVSYPQVLMLFLWNLHIVSDQTLSAV